MKNLKATNNMFKKTKKYYVKKFVEILSHNTCLILPRLIQIQVYYSHGSLLVHLKHPDAAYLTFDEANLNEGTRLKLKAGHSTDPVQVFAASAFAMDVPIRMSNHHFYGHTLTVGARPWPNRRTHQQMVFSVFLDEI